MHTLKRSLKNLGSAIIIHFQRYHSANPNARVAVSKSLDMSRYIPGAGVYSLCSAIHHKGIVSSGHYTCYARARHGWMHFDDQRVYRISEFPRSKLDASTVFIYAQEPS